MLVISNGPRARASSSRFELVQFWNYSHDYSLNYTLLGSVTITYSNRKYHPMCYARFLRIRRKSRLRKRQSRGQMFRGRYNSTPAEAFWSPYQLGQKYQLQSRVFKSNRFKDRIQEFLGDTATFGLYAEFTSTSKLSFSEQVLEQNVSHENYLNFIRNGHTVTYIFIRIVSHKDSF